MKVLIAVAATMSAAWMCAYGVNSEICSVVLLLVLIILIGKRNQERKQTRWTR